MPQGHNYFPDVAKIVPGGPGSFGGFRDRAQINRWFRFLTEPDGNVAGIDLIAPGVNPAVVPIPAPLPGNVLQGTAAQGNNNDVSLLGLHDLYLEHGYNIVAGQPAPGVIGNGPAAEYVSPWRIGTEGYLGGWPGEFYKGGSQGALQPVKTIRRNF